MNKGSLYDFNARNTGLYEARLWKAYYDRRWLLALSLLFRLLRSQFNLGLAYALRATYWGIRAAIVFAPKEHDDEAVRHLLRRFYAVVHAGCAGRFDPHAAGDAELDYWVVHRRLAGQQGTPALVRSLAVLTARVYDLPLERAEPAAVERARACDLVDDITGGQQAPTRDAWAAVEIALCRSYTLLRGALDAAA